MPTSGATARASNSPHTPKSKKKSPGSKAQPRKPEPEPSSDESDFIETPDNMAASDSVLSRDETAIRHNAPKVQHPEHCSRATRIQGEIIDSLDGKNEEHKVQWAASSTVRQFIDNACEWFPRHHISSKTPEDALAFRCKGFKGKEWFEQPRDIDFDLYLLTHPAPAGRVLLMVDHFLAIEKALFSRNDTQSIPTLAEIDEDCFQYLTSKARSTKWKCELENLEQDFITGSPSQMANKLLYFEIKKAVNALRSLVRTNKSFWSDFDAETEESSLFFEKDQLVTSVQYKSGLLYEAVGQLQNALAVGDEQQPLGLADEVEQQNSAAESERDEFHDILQERLIVDKNELRDMVTEVVRPIVNEVIEKAAHSSIVDKTIAELHTLLHSQKEPQQPMLKKKEFQDLITNAIEPLLNQYLVQSAPPPEAQRAINEIRDTFKLLNDQAKTKPHDIWLYADIFVYRIILAFAIAWLVVLTTFLFTIQPSSILLAGTTLEKSLLPPTVVNAACMNDTIDTANCQVTVRGMEAPRFVDQSEGWTLWS